VALFLILLVACTTSLATPQEESTEPPPIPTITTTPTIVWFPPTATFTPFPTPVITPTVDLHPRIGELIFSDEFSDPTLWSLNRTSTSSIAFGKNEITLAISQPGLYLFTLRKSPILSDFYLEITASTGICINEDEYGILFRVTPSLDFYRFSLTCNGQIRLDKYFKGRASSPQPKMFSGTVPRGAPGFSRLAVWVYGKEMDFYINNEYQFSVRDPSILSGSLGVFAHSAGENAMSVSFSELVVNKVAK
jgi:hypothetical protein